MKNKTKKAIAVAAGMIAEGVLSYLLTKEFKDKSKKRKKKNKKSISLQQA